MFQSFQRLERAMLSIARVRARLAELKHELDRAEIDGTARDKIRSTDFQRRLGRVQYLNASNTVRTEILGHLRREMWTALIAATALIVVGGGVAAVGFSRWSERVQVPQDELLRIQLEQARESARSAPKPPT